MKKIINKSYLTLGVLLGIILLAVIISCAVISVKSADSENNWILRSYDNTVVLMNNGEVVEVFGDIVIDTLPDEDIKHLENGIPFLSKDEALMAIEDYDG